MQALLDAIATMSMPADARRIFHGRGGLHPGCEHWTLDAFAPVWVVTSFQPVTDAELATIHAALSARWMQLNPAEPLNWVFQYRHEAQAETRLMAGSVPEPHVVTENGARFRVHLPKGLNHGFFLDMAEGRRWVREHVATRRGLKVLNLFAYTCSFSVVALLAGARQVVNMDMSDSALAIGKRNHLLNGLTAGASFLPHDIFASLLCLNSPKLGVAFLQEQMQALAPGLKFEQRLSNPAAFADVSSERSLKVLVYKAPE